VTGSAVLQSRTIKASYAISVTTGGVSHTPDALSAVMTWTPNGYQAVIPYINGSSTFNTICFINNSSSTGAPITLSVQSTESNASLTALSGIAIGTVGALQTMRIDFNSSVTPYSYSGTTEVAGTAIPLSVQGNDRYSALLSVGANPTAISVNCIQADPAGSKRAVPVLVPQQGGSSTAGSYIY